MGEIIRHNNIDISKLNYSKPISQQKVYYSSIDYTENPCYIQSTKLVIEDIKEENKQKYLVTRVNANDFSFYDLLVSLDDHNLSTTYKSSNEWFNKKLPMDVLEGMYRRITKPFKKNETPLIECKIPISKNTVQCKIYDTSNNIINFDKLTKGTSIVCIIHVKGLKFLKKDYYCDHYISQIKLCDPIQSISPYSIPSTCLIDYEEEYEPVHEYEIIDEDVIQMRKENLDLVEKYNVLEKQIVKDQSILLELKNKIDNLK